MWPYVYGETFVCDNVRSEGRSENEYCKVRKEEDHQFFVLGLPKPYLWKKRGATSSAAEIEQENTICVCVCVWQ